MSHSRKDGRKGGGHVNTQNKEIWSRRCKLVNMGDPQDPRNKVITHRYERRVARREIIASLTEMSA